MKILVSPQDEALLAAYPWRLNNYGYAIRSFMEGGVKGYELLHRVLVGAKAGEIVDHINGIPLDCRRENLRICTHAENMRNRKISKSNSLGFKGVYKDGKRYRAQIDIDKCRIRLGSFKTAEAAYSVYCEAAKKYHGEFARLR